MPSRSSGSEAKPKPPTTITAGPITSTRRRPSQPTVAPTGPIPVEPALFGLLLLLPVVFSRSTEDSFDFPKSALLTTGALILLGWGLALELTRRFQRQASSGMGPRLASFLRKDPLGGALLLFCLSSALSTAFSPNPGYGVFGGRGSHAGLLVACGATTLYFASRSLRGDERALRRLAVAAGIGSAIAAAYGLIQFLGHDPLDWRGLAVLRGLRRVPGTMGQPNVLAGYLTMCLPLVVWLAVSGASRVSRLMWCAAGVLALAVIGSTLSRASWLALGVSAMAAAGFMWVSRRPGQPLLPSRRHRVAATVIVIAMVSGAILLARGPMGGPLAARVRETTDLSESANASRLESWRAALRMASDRPVLGVGTDQFGLAFPAYRTPNHYRLEAGGIAATAHNAALNVLANQGAFGFLALILVLGLSTVTMWRALRSLDSRARLGAVAAASSLTGFVLWASVNYIGAGMAGLPAALMGWLAASTPPSAPRRARPKPAGWTWVVAGIVVAFAWVPLVLRPWRAQTLQLTAVTAPLQSARRARALIEASALAPWNGWNQQNLATSLEAVARAESDSTRALELMRRALEAQRHATGVEPRNGPFRARLGTLLDQVRRHGGPEASLDDIRAAFDQAIQLDPSNPNVMDEATQVMIGLGQHAHARPIALTNATRFPEIASPLGHLGLMALREGRPAGAIDTLELALTRDWRGDQDAVARAYANLSGAYLALGRFAEAERAADQALAIDPEMTAASANRDAARRWAEEISRLP